MDYPKFIVSNQKEESIRLYKGLIGGFPTRNSQVSISHDPGEMRKHILFGEKITLNLLQTSIFHQLGLEILNHVQV